MVRNINIGAQGASVSGLNGNYCFICNRGTSTLYASEKSPVTAEKNGVLGIEPGARGILPISGSVVYFSGSGYATVIDSTEPINFIEPPDNSSGGGDSQPNANLLINPAFSVNQRGVSGTVSAGGYAADMWKVESGTAVRQEDGSILLNGTIAQQLYDIPAGGAVCSSDGGTAAYADGVFRITAAGKRVSWAKLEAGSVVTPYAGCDAFSELLKCQQFFFRISNTGSAKMLFGTAAASSATALNLVAALPVRMKGSPAVAAEGEVFSCGLTATAAVNATSAARNGQLDERYVTILLGGEFTAGSPVNVYLNPGKHIDFYVK